jgi:hypothetical protein
VTINLFCEGLSRCDRGHSFYRDGTDINVSCFVERTPDSSGIASAAS